MENILLLPLIISFFVALFFLPLWIKKAKQLDLMWKDMNKSYDVKVAGSGGLIVVMAFCLGVLTYVAIKTFLLKTESNMVEIFVLLATVSFAAIIGFVDDMMGWMRGGLSMRLRIVLVLFSAIPLMVINAGSSVMDFPVLGLVNLGIIYPLIIIPLGVVGVVTTYNMLAGFNGLEAGQGIIIISFLSFIAYRTDNRWLALIGLCMAVSLAAFYLFNKNPAEVFPGDVMTYSIGGVIVCMAILGNMEKIAMFVFIPYMIEVVLKVRGRLAKQSFGIPNKEGLDVPYEKFYGLEHISIYLLKKMKGNAKESEVVWLINGFQIALCIIAFFIFGGF